ncbi:MAG: hypothetical protein WBP43_04470 [Chitinophagales bacterium]
MKNLFTIICFMSITVASQAQSAKFNDAMTKALAEMDTLKTGDQFMAMSNKFERIALAEKNQWLPYYYAALSRVTATYIYNEPAKNDVILDVAEKYINVADSLMPNNSEIYVVKSMILGGRIMVDPMTRGQMYGMQSMMHLSKAMTLDPENPRSYYVMGLSLFYTPPQFGGGQDKGCEMLNTAKAKYATFKPASDLHPSWGEDQVDETLKQCTPPATPAGSGNN